LIFEPDQRLKTFITLIAFFFIASQAVAQVDTIVVEVRFTQKPFNQAIRELHRKTGLSFAMEGKVLSDHLVNFNLPNARLSTVLYQMLNGTGYSYKLLGEAIAIYQLPEEAILFDGTYAGRVADAYSGEPLPFSSIIIVGTDLAVLADANGHFYFENVPSDSLVLLAQFIGYKPLKYLPRSEKRDEILILLVPDPENLPVAEIVSNDQGIGNYEALTSAYSFNHKLILDVQGAGVRDALRPLLLIPGLNAANESFAGFEVRGASPDQARIYFDGIPVYHTDHFFGVLSAFNAEAIQHVKTSRGGFSAAMGDANSALIQITGKEGNRYFAKTTAGVDLLCADFSLTAPFPDRSGSFVIAGRRSFTDFLPGPTYKSLYNNVFASSTGAGSQDLADAFSQSAEPDFYFFDINSRITWDLSSKDQLKLSFFRSEDNLKASYLLEIPESLRSLQLNDGSSWGNTGGSMHWDRQWSPKSASSFLASYSSYSSAFDQKDVINNLVLNSSDTLISQQTGELLDFTLRAEHHFQTVAHNVKAGIWYYSRSIDYRSVSPSELDTARVAQRGNGIAIFIEDRFPLRKNVEVLGGIRATYFDLARDFRAEPRLAFTWKIKNLLGLKLATGWHSQTIRQIRSQDLYLNTADLWRISNGKSVPVLNSRHLLLGIFGDVENFHWELEGYVRDSEGELLDPLDLSNTLGDEGADPYYLAKGRSIGFDLSISHRYRNWSNWLSYSLAQSTLRSEQLAFGEWFNAPTDQRHLVKWFSQYQHKGWNLNLNAVLGSGRRYTPLIGLFDAELINGTQISYAQYGVAYSGKLPNYKRFDFGLGKSFKWQKANCSAGISVYNIFNEMNVKNRVFSIDNSTLNPSVNQRDIPFVGIIPGINFRITWE